VKPILTVEAKAALARGQAVRFQWRLAPNAGAAAHARSREARDQLAEALRRVAPHFLVTTSTDPTGLIYIVQVTPPRLPRRLGSVGLRGAARTLRRIALELPRLHSRP
jgi:hypothetical protein